MNYLCSGNTYSRGHVNQSLSEKEYWRFTWDEHAEYDLPAMLELMMEVTGQEEYFYLGHSMGTLTYFTACNYHGWVCNNTRLMVGYGPHTAVPHLVRINSPTHQSNPTTQSPVNNG